MKKILIMLAALFILAPFLLALAEETDNASTYNAYSLGPPHSKHRTNVSAQFVQDTLAPHFLKRDKTVALKRGQRFSRHKIKPFFRHGCQPRRPKDKRNMRFSAPHRAFKNIYPFKFIALQHRYYFLLLRRKNFINAI